MIVIFLISIGLTGVILGMYPAEIRRIEGFGEEEEDADSDSDSDSDEEEEVVEEKVVEVVAKKKKPSVNKMSDKLSLSDIQKMLNNSKKVADDEDMSKEAVKKKMFDIYKETMANIAEKTNSLNFGTTSIP